MFFIDSFRTIFSWKSIIDIGLVAILFYQIISMLRGTRAAQVLIGMLVIFVAYVFSNILQFETLHWIISKFYSSFIIVVIVLFQDDIRRLLSRFGKGPFFTGIEARSGVLIIEEVVNAAKSLSHERIGALIVFERSIGLDKLYDHSVQLGAIVSEQLLISIFQSFSPLHDGAVIIQKNRISCASAQLPLSKNPLFSKKMGTRHSAAVGISEETDAVVLVVSEETGNISIAWEGNLQKQTSPDAAKKMLNILLLPRGERNAVASFIEDTLLFNINKYYLLIKKVCSFKKNQNFVIERRRNFDRRLNKSALEAMDGAQEQFMKQEKIQASSQSKNIFVHLANDTEIKELNHSSEDEKLVLSGIAPQNNEALKAIAELSPEDRFDPPIPKPPPPRDVSIGGVSLNPPLDKENNGVTGAEQAKKDNTE